MSTSRQSIALAQCRVHRSCECAPTCGAGDLDGQLPSIFALEILGEPDDVGNAPLIEKRIVRGANFEEARLIANACVLDAEKHGARGYCLMDHKGLVVTRWFMAKEPR